MSLHIIAAAPTPAQAPGGRIVAPRRGSFARFDTLLRRISQCALGALLALAAPAAAQQEGAVAAHAPLPAPAPDTRPLVALDTDAGTIILRLEDVRAPVSAANFLRYVDAGRYVGEPFYRTSRNWGAHAAFVQAGVRSDARKHFAPIAHEPTSVTGLTHCPGAVSFARAAPGSATSDFFILLSPIKQFDADPAAAGDNLGFAAFAAVVAGWDVVQAIHTAPVSDTAGEGVMLGQILAELVRIKAARRIAPDALPTDPAKPVPDCIVATPKAVSAPDSTN